MPARLCRPLAPALLINSTAPAPFPHSGQASPRQPTPRDAGSSRAPPSSPAGAFAWPPRGRGGCGLGGRGEGCEPGPPPSQFCNLSAGEFPRSRLERRAGQRRGEKTPGRWPVWSPFGRPSRKGRGGTRKGAGEGDDSGYGAGDRFGVLQQDTSSRTPGPGVSSLALSGMRVRAERRQCVFAR